MFGLELPALASVIAGALIAGFVTGFAGFGTGLVASGLWFHALPAGMVPPLVALSSVAAQCAGMIAIRPTFSWPAATPFLIGGIVGIPAGVLALSALSPSSLRLAVGLFLVAYALFRLTRPRPWTRAAQAGRFSDGIIGGVGGFLGGFAGLSGPVPIIWLQGKGLSFERQRAIFQPFNMVILTIASLLMAWEGRLDGDVLKIAALALPLTLAGAWIGGRLYRRVEEKRVIRIVLVLLFLSGALMIAQAAQRAA